jgi:hypothetical protein
MARKGKLDEAVDHIDRHGILLVYPIDNRAEPKSLWSCLHPKREMRWAWDESADPRVVELWHLREALARSKRVVYGKWYRRRATFFSHAAFRGLLGALDESSALEPDTLSEEARTILELLEEARRRPRRGCAAPPVSRASSSKAPSSARSTSCGSAR